MLNIKWQTVTISAVEMSLNVGVWWTLEWHHQKMRVSNCVVAVVHIANSWEQGTRSLRTRSYHQLGVFHFVSFSKYWTEDCGCRCYRNKRKLILYNNRFKYRFLNTSFGIFSWLEFIIKHILFSFLSMTFTILRSNIKLRPPTTNPTDFYLENLLRFIALVEVNVPSRKFADHQKTHTYKLLYTSIGCRNMNKPKGRVTIHWAWAINRRNMIQKI